MAKSNKIMQVVRAGGAAAVGCAAGIGVVVMFGTGVAEGGPGLLLSAGLVGAVTGALVGLATYGTYLVFSLEEPYV